MRDGGYGAEGASMHVAMIGAGYVGLVTGACFAEFGHVVTCIDNDPAKVAALKRGEMPIFEPGLAELVASNVAAHRHGYKLIVTKSTVPVGTGDEIARIVSDLRPDARFAVVSNPEFLREGAAIADFMQPDRVVIGTEDPRAQDMMRELYRPLVANNTPIVFTERRGAELIKYAANAFLATKITFINEIADLCEQA